MTSSIDNRIVSMKFDNKGFAAGVATTLSMLAGLKQATSDSGLNDMQAQADRFNMGSMDSEVSGVSKKFLALSTIGITALSRLTNAGIDFGKSIVKSVTEPLIGLGKQRALNFEKSDFLLKGLGFDAEQIDRVMTAANAAVEGTAYGLDEAANAAAKFAVAGTPIEELEGKLRAIAGTAAITSSDFNQIATIFTQVSTAGRLTTLRMQQLETAGLEVSTVLGDAMGKTSNEIRQMVTNGEISFDQFASIMDDAFGEHAQRANETYTGSLANMRAAIGRIGADYQERKMAAMITTFNAITPVINSIRDAVKPLNIAFGEIMGGNANRLAEVLANVDFSKFDRGFEILGEGFKNINSAVGSVLKPLAEAFRDIFPPMTTKRFESFASAFENLTSKFIAGEETGEKLRRTFRGIFAIFSIAGQILGQVISLFGRLLGEIFKNSGGFLDFTGSISDWLVRVDEALKKGDGLANVFQKIGDFIVKPIEGLRKLGRSLGPVTDSLGVFKDAFADSLDFEKVMTAATAALAGGAFLLIKRFFSRGTAGSLLGDIRRSFTAPLFRLRIALEEMQMNLRANVLLKIAAAVVILAGAMVVLSQINHVDLAKALAAMGTGMGILLGAMLIMEKHIKAFFRMPIMAASLVALATAMLILSAALKVFATMSLEEIAKGLGVLAGSLMILTVAMKFMQGAIGGAATIFIVANALLILAPALLMFSSMSWQEIAKAMVVLAGSLAILAVGMAAMKIALPGAAALFIVAPALLLLAGTMVILGKLSWSEIGRGLVALGGALLILAIGLTAMIIALPGAFALTVAAKGLLALSIAMVALGKLSWKEIGKGLAAIAGALTILGIATLILAPLVPAMLGLGVALALIGAGLALAGAGALAFSIAAVTLSASGAIVLLFLKNLVEMAPLVAQKFAEAMATFVITILEVAPAIVEGLDGLLQALLKLIENNIPNMHKTFVKLVRSGLSAVRKLSPDIVKTGLQLLLDFLKGIRDNIGDIVEVVSQLVQEFILSLGKQTVDIIAAGGEMLIDFLDGLSAWIDGNSARIGTAVGGLGRSIIVGIINGMRAAIRELNPVGVIRDLGAELVSAANPANWGSPFYGFGQAIPEDFSSGLDSGQRVLTRAFSDLNESMRKSMDLMERDADLSPRITPVLELEQLRKDAKDVGSIFDKQTDLSVDPHFASRSLHKARVLSAEQSLSRSEESKETTTKEVKFEQNIHSPKALDTIEIYRNTRSQIALAKEALEDDDD